MRPRVEETFARRIREVAAEQKLPLSHLADRCGMARSFFWRIVKASGSATLGTVQRIAEQLGVEPWELLRERPTDVRTPGAPAPPVATRRASEDSSGPLKVVNVRKARGRTPRKAGA